METFSRCLKQRTWAIPVTSLVALKVLPFDLVLALDHIFSAKDVARPIPLVLFFGESDGNEVELLCTGPFCMYPNSLMGDARVPNSKLLSGGVTAAAESSDEISDEVELLWRAGCPLVVPGREMLPRRLKLAI